MGITGREFEAVAEHAGTAYLRYSFTKGTDQEVRFLADVEDPIFSITLEIVEGSEPRRYDVTETLAGLERAVPMPQLAVTAQRPLLEALYHELA